MFEKAFGNWRKTGKKSHWKPCSAWANWMVENKFSSVCSPTHLVCGIGEWTEQANKENNWNGCTCSACVHWIEWDAMLAIMYDTRCQFIHTHMAESWCTQSIHIWAWTSHHGHGHEVVEQSDALALSVTHNQPRWWWWSVLFFPRQWMNELVKCGLVHTRTQPPPHLDSHTPHPLDLPLARSPWMSMIIAQKRCNCSAYPDEVCALELDSSQSGSVRPGNFRLLFIKGFHRVSGFWYKERNSWRSRRKQTQQALNPRE